MNKKVRSVSAALVLQNVAEHTARSAASVDNCERRRYLKRQRFPSRSRFLLLVALLAPWFFVCGGLSWILM